MAPHSPGTDQIDTLLWIGIVAAAILMVAVTVALLYVVRRFRSERGAEPRQLLSGRRLQFRVGAVLTVFAALLFVLGVIFTDNAREKPSTGDAGLASLKSEPLKIKATGQQWLWRYDYPNGAFSYYKLVVPVDTAVELELLSTDVVHTWNVAELARKADAVPGKTNRVFFSTDDEGDLPGRLRDPLRPGLRRDADRGRSRLARGIRRLRRNPEGRHRGRPGTGRRPDRKRRNAMSPSPRPELVADGFAPSRPRWHSWRPPPTTRTSAGSSSAAPSASSSSP